MSLFNRPTKLVTIRLRSCVDLCEIDQLMAGADYIQATQGHQRADCGLAFTESKQLSAEIGETALRSAQVLHGLVILADLPGTDRQFSRSRQLHVAEGKHPFQRVLAEAQNRLYRSTDQLESDLA